MRGGPDDQQVAEGPRRDRVPGGAVARVEPPLEPDLDESPGPFDLGLHDVERPELERDRLLAERRDPVRRGEPDEGRVAGRRGRDHDRVDPRFEELLRRVRDRDADLTRELSSSRHFGVRDNDRGHALERLQGLHVKGAHPADTDHADVEIARHGSGYSKRFQEGLSSGGAVEPRTTSSGGRRCRRWRISRPLASSRRSSVAVCAISSAGCRIVVSGGVV